MIKKTLTGLLLGAFLVAAALHPATHAEGAGAPEHACPLTVAGPDRVAAPPALDVPLFVLTGRLPAVPAVAPRSAVVPSVDARGPPAVS